MPAAAARRWTYEEYLVAEDAAEYKHEFLDGEVWAMSGGTPDHGLLAASAIVALVQALGGRPCRVYSSDVRIRVPETGLATYPDVSVVCGRLARHPEDKDAVTNPVLIVEVLSESTELRDRSVKFAHYERLPSLRHYLLVAQDQVRIEQFRRNDDGTWTWRSYAAGDSIALDSLDCAVAVDDIYARTELLERNSAGP